MNLNIIWTMDGFKVEKEPKLIWWKHWTENPGSPDRNREVPPNGERSSEAEHRFVEPRVGISKFLVHPKEGIT